MSMATVEIGGWESPLPWIWLAGCDICGYGVSWEEENLDESAGPLQSIDSSAVCIEGRAIAPLGGLNTAASS